MNKKTVLPQLRFIKFEDSPAWSIKSIGEMSVPVTDRAGTKKYILMSVTSGVGLITQIEKFGREIAGNAYNSYYVIKKNDFAYNKSATKQFPEGYISMLTEYEEAALPNSIFICFRIVDEECVPQFIDYLFQNNYHGLWLRKYIEVGARAHGSLSVDTKHLWDMPVALPKTEEQQKIADCLSSLDELIAAENRKLESLREHKRGLLQKMFPVAGRTVPEIRFPGFTDAWEQRKLGSFTTSYSGGTPSVGKAEYYGGSIPFIRSAEINADSTELFLTERGLNNSSAKMVGIGDILYALYGATSGEVGRSRLCGAINQAILAIKPTDNDDPEFIAQWLQGQKKSIINTYLQGGQGNLSGDIVKELVITKPTDKAEQAVIGSFFASLDRLITLHQRKSEFLRVHKKGLMQGLFPSVEEVDE